MPVAWNYSSVSCFYPENFYKLDLIVMLLKLKPGIIVISAGSFNPLLGYTRSRGRCWAAIQLSPHPEPSGHAVHGKAGGLDIQGQHGWQLVLLHQTHRPQRGLYPFVQARVETSNTSAEALSQTHAVLGIPWGWMPVESQEGGCQCRRWKYGVS